jgi:hypothetical protein
MPWLLLTSALFAVGMLIDKRIVRPKSLAQEAFDIETQKLVAEAVKHDTLEIRGWFYCNPKTKDSLGSFEFSAKRIKPSNIVLLGEKRVADGQLVQSIIEVGTVMTAQNKTESTRTPFYVTQKNFKILQEIVNQVKGHHMTLL